MSDWAWGRDAADARSLARSRFGAVVVVIGVFLFYSAATLLFVGPNIGRLGTEFIGDGGDNWVFVWNTWWVKRCLVEGSNPYFCSMQFAPMGIPLTSHCITMVATLIMVGLAEIVPMALAYNLVLLLFFPFAGLSAFALARYVTRDTLASMVGGLVFMICPFLTSKTLGHLNLMGAAFLPLYVVCLLRALELPNTARRLQLTAAFILILFLNEHTLIFAANVTVWLFLYRALRHREWKAEFFRFWQALKPLVAVSAAWGAFLMYYAVRFGAQPYRTGAIAYCPEPLNFLLPLFPTSIWRDRVCPPGQLGWDMSTLELSVYLGWLVLPMAVAGFWSRRGEPLMRFMGVLFVTAFVIALGQKLQWHREIVRLAGLTVYLPMGIYRYVPALGAVGQSGRYMIIGYMAMSAAVAAFVVFLRQRLGTLPFAIALTLIAIFIGTDYGFRFQTVTAPPCPIPPGPGRVMDVRPDPSLGLYFQTFHERPLVGGYVSRWPVGVFDHYRASPGIGWFFTRVKYRGTPPSGSQIVKDLREWDIAYVCANVNSTEAKILSDAGLRVYHSDGYGVTFEVGRDSPRPGSVPATR